MTTPHWIDTPITSELVRGAAELEPTPNGLLPHRLPAWARAECPDPQLTGAESQAAGVRLAFRTRASTIELDTLRTRTNFVGPPARPLGVYDLIVDGNLTDQQRTTGGNEVRITPPAGPIELIEGPVGTVTFTGLPEDAKDIEIWLPHNERTELVALRTNAAVEPSPAPDRRIWLHHGSSISQGSNAENPTGTWPVRASQLGGVELINLGLGGSALLDPFVARILRDTPADLISIKMGINIVNADLMRLRAFGPAVHGFIDTIRDGHPETPLLVISPVYCPIHEDTPGPGAFDHAALAENIVRFRATGDPTERAAGKLTLAVIRDELARIVGERSATDENLHYLDGQELYGPADFDELPLPDALHPDAASHHRMGDRFAALAFGPDGPFSATSARNSA